LVRSGVITEDNYHEYGLRIRSASELTPDYDRKELEIEEKKKASGAAAANTKQSNKACTYKSKR
jgi:hypothetical protein